MAKRDILETLYLRSDGYPNCSSYWPSESLEKDILAHLDHLRAHRSSPEVNSLASDLLVDGKLDLSRFHQLVGSCDGEGDPCCPREIEAAKVPLWYLEKESEAWRWIEERQPDLLESNASLRKLRELVCIPLHVVQAQLKIEAAIRRVGNKRGTSKKAVLTLGDCKNTASRLVSQKDQGSQHRTPNGRQSTIRVEPSIFTSALSPRDAEHALIANSDITETRGGSLDGRLSNCNFASPRTPKRQKRDRSDGTLVSQEETIIIHDSGATPEAPSARSEFRIQHYDLEPLEREQGDLGDEVVNKALAILCDRAIRPFKLVDSQTRRPYGTSTVEKDDWAFAPLHLGSHRHWVLGVIDPSRRQVKIYDSLFSTQHGPEAERQVTTIYQNLAWNDFKPAITWTSPIVQSDNTSCGIFALAAASYIAAGHDVVAEVQYAPWRKVFHELLRPVCGQEEAKPRGANNRTFEDLMEFQALVKRSLTQRIDNYYRKNVSCVEVFRTLEGTDGKILETLERVRRVVRYLETNEGSEKGIKVLENQLKCIEKFERVARESLLEDTSSTAL